MLRIMKQTRGEREPAMGNIQRHVPERRAIRWPE